MRTTNCPVCQAPTTVVPFYVGGRGYVDCVVCPEGAASYDDDHPGIIERLESGWRLAEIAEDARRLEAEHARWKAAMRSKAIVGAVLAACWAVVFALWR